MATPAVNIAGLAVEVDGNCGADEGEEFPPKLNDGELPKLKLAPLVAAPLVVVPLVDPPLVVAAVKNNGCPVLGLAPEKLKRVLGPPLRAPLDRGEGCSDDVIISCCCWDPNWRPELLLPVATDAAPNGAVVVETAPNEKTGALLESEGAGAVEAVPREKPGVELAAVEREKEEGGTAVAEEEEEEEGAAVEPKEGGTAVAEEKEERGAAVEPKEGGTAVAEAGNSVAVREVELTELEGAIPNDRLGVELAANDRLGVVLGAANDRLGAVVDAPNVNVGAGAVAAEEPVRERPRAGEDETDPNKNFGGLCELTAVEPKVRVGAWLAAVEPRVRVGAWLAAVEPRVRLGAWLAAVEPRVRLGAWLAAVEPKVRLGAWLAAVEPNVRVDPVTVVDWLPPLKAGAAADDGGWLAAELDSPPNGMTERKKITQCKLYLRLH